MGSPAAPVTVIEYASVACPECAAFHNQVFPTFKVQYIDTGKVRWILREALTGDTALAAAGFLTAHCAGKAQYFNVVDDMFHAQAQMFASGNPQPSMLEIAGKDGGLGLGQAISERSVYAINSGPASAPQAGLFVTAPFKKKNVITIDMGGTSFDITLTRNGVTNISKNIDMLRYRIGIPMIQVETLGAGGGSIGWIDSMGLLQVGPQSAGATPGPACYDQGGTQPTVTDANLVLGYLSPKGLLGGRLPLDQEKARNAIKSVADPLGISVERAAYGMFTIVNSNMVNMAKLFTEIRAVPNLENGTSQGFRLSEIEPGSIFQNLGLQDGDVLTSVSGQPVGDPAKAIPSLCALLAA